MLDLVILGGSIAGVTAAVYGQRRNLNLKLITPEIGGEIATTTDIENWPGENSISGWDFSQKLHQQLQYNKIPVDLGWAATKIEKVNDGFSITIKNLSGEEKTEIARAVIVATGATPRLLQVEGEKDFFHKGVTYCATCDAPLFKNKITAVVGGGNSALTSALMLVEIASEVTLLNINADFRGESVLIDKVKNHPKIKILSEVKVQKINGEKMVQSLNYSDKNGIEHTLPVQGIFVNIGLRANADFIDLVEKNPWGEIKTDRAGCTNVPGFFAAGDVTDVPYKQIVIAGGSGSLAALSAIDFLNQK
ncbi:MAG TPA: FAD-dependent oxidoreductase [Candidatus Magasanikbacteria bacterium]|nr:FAD-dependent oxidoreductase [Candidatus Magasanikbacteria bacterium]